MQSMMNQRDHLEYELTVRQEPKQARMCGIGGKADRRPIDPPPIVQLRVVDPTRRGSNGNGTDDSTNDSSSTYTDPETEYAYAQSYLQNPYYFMFACLAKPDDEAELHWLKDGRTRCTTGSVVSSLYHLRDPQNQNADAGFFVFPDLSVRTEGSYRLKLSLFEVVGSSVRHCKSIFSSPFYVYTAKKFPGMEESTALSCALADQGIKIRIRKDIRVRKRPSNAPEANVPFSPATPLSTTSHINQFPIIANTPINAHELPAPSQPGGQPITGPMQPPPTLLAEPSRPSSRQVRADLSDEDGGSETESERRGSRGNKDKNGKGRDRKRRKRSDETEPSAGGGQYGNFQLPGATNPPTWTSNAPVIDPALTGPAGAPPPTAPPSQSTSSDRNVPSYDPRYRGYYESPPGPPAVPQSSQGNTLTSGGSPYQYSTHPPAPPPYAGHQPSAPPPGPQSYTPPGSNSWGAPPHPQQHSGTYDSYWPPPTHSYPQHQPQQQQPRYEAYAPPPPPPTYGPPPVQHPGYGHPAPQQTYHYMPEANYNSAPGPSAEYSSGPARGSHYQQQPPPPQSTPGNAGGYYTNTPPPPGHYGAPQYLPGPGYPPVPPSSSSSPVNHNPPTSNAAGGDPSWGTQANHGSWNNNSSPESSSYSNHRAGDRIQLPPIRGPNSPSSRSGKDADSNKKKNPLSIGSIISDDS